MNTPDGANPSTSISDNAAWETLRFRLDSNLSVVPPVTNIIASSSSFPLFNFLVFFLFVLCWICDGIHHHHHSSSPTLVNGTIHWKMISTYLFYFSCFSSSFFLSSFSLLSLFSRVVNFLFIHYDNKSQPGSYPATEYMCIKGVTKGGKADPGGS
jgi:hypothetical protein